MRISRNQILFFGLAAHLITAIFSIGYHQCDELFQVYEFAGYKLGINQAGDLPWEFNAQMRSGLQPFIVYVFTKGLHAISVCDPFTIALWLRLLISVTAFWASLRLLRILESDVKDPAWRSWLWLFSLLFWCIPYFHARFSSENFSVVLFMLGLSVVLKPEPIIQKRRAVWRYLMAGLLFGLAFMCRFQIIFMLAGLCAWLVFVQRNKGTLILSALPGVLAGIFIGMLADRWLYGHWTFSPWNYLDLNLFQDKASQFGREPFYFYIGESLLQLIPPFSLFIVAAVILFWFKFPKHALTWITLPFVLLHFFVEHKELRFLFPILNFLPFMLVIVWQWMRGQHPAAYKRLSKKWLLKSAVFVNLALLLYFMLKPADQTSFMLKKIYDTVDGARPILIYDDANPYNNANSLNYFRKAEIQTVELNKDSIVDKDNPDIYYLSEKQGQGVTLVKAHKTFVKVYANYPEWARHLDFNGWLERSGVFCIYKETR